MKTMRLTDEGLAALLRSSNVRLNKAEGVDIDRVHGTSAPPPARSKYGNVRTQTEDGVFDSKREAARYRQLRGLLRAGIIQALARQVDFLLPGGVIYRADFTYTCTTKSDTPGRQVIEDAKGHRTQTYALKRRLMEAEGFTITEV